MSIVTLEEAQARLPQLLEQLQPGEEITIIDHGRPLAQVKKAERTSWPCHAGSYQKAGFWMAPDFDAPLDESKENMVLDQIIVLNEQIRSFWHNGGRGWAPSKAATMLENSRLDRLVSLSHCLRLWTQPCSEAEDEGQLILAWANLGILVEGTMTWFLCVWEHAYALNPMQSRSGKDLEANRLWFEEMIRFYRQHIWGDGQRDGWNDWLTMVRERRNAVHAFHHRELGTWDEFWQAVIRYHELIDELNSRVPYPERADYE